jgi:hypothetical protein
MSDRGVLVVAGGLSVIALVGSIALTVATGQLILLLFGIIVAAAPWGAVIDQLDRAEKERERAAGERDRDG